MLCVIVAMLFHSEFSVFPAMSMHSWVSMLEVKLWRGLMSLLPHSSFTFWLPKFLNLLRLFVLFISIFMVRVEIMMRMWKIVWSVMIVVKFEIRIHGLVTTVNWVLVIINKLLLFVR